MVLQIAHAALNRFADVLVIRCADRSGHARGKPEHQCAKPDSTAHEVTHAKVVDACVSVPLGACVSRPLHPGKRMP
jgi:hypothetical protein